jgi:hypothetical protein
MLQHEILLGLHDKEWLDELVDGLSNCIGVVRVELKNSYDSFTVIIQW